MASGKGGQGMRVETDRGPLCWEGKSGSTVLLDIRICIQAGEALDRRGSRVPPGLSQVCLPPACSVAEDCFAFRFAWGRRVNAFAGGKIWFLHA